MSRGVFGGALLSVVAAAGIVIGVRAEQSSSPQGIQTYVVQLSGPVLESWKAALIAEGAELHEYVPRFAFRARMSAPVAARVRRLSFVASVTPVRAPDKLARGLVRNGRRIYLARLEPGADVRAVESALAAAGLQVGRRGNRGLLVVADGAGVDAISAIDGVATIEDYAPRIKHNEYGGGAIVGSAAVNANGYDGSSQTIAIADTGLGNGTASGAHAGIAPGRILSIVNWPGVPDFCFDTITSDGAIDVDSGHGTHVATAALGAGNASGVGRGTAPGAGLVFQAVEDYAVPSLLCSLLYGLPEAYYLVGIPDDVGDLFNQGYQQGARVHSNSWGAEVAGEYTADSANADAFVWAHRDMAVTFSAGNSGTDTDADGIVDEVSINAPGSAKNVITVGASENDRQSHWECDTALTYTSCSAQGGQNAIFTYGSAWPERFGANPLRDDPSAGNAEQLAAFSSRGPTSDGRIKPDVVAPGTWTLSGYSDRYQQQYDAAPNPVNGLYQYDGWGFPLDSAYKYMGGTSMSAPLVAGGAAVVRDYYQKARGHQASAALVKAALVNSAVDLLDENNDGVLDNANPIPNPHEGWGRVDLAGATDGSEWFVDETAPLVTGSTAAYTFDVTSPGVPFKATLVWTDYPAIASAEIALVNDLDLILVAPDGTTYAGNVFAGGWSTTGGSPDRVNNVENVYVFSGAAGTWTVNVSGFNVPNGPQPFALVLDTPSIGSGMPKVRVTVDDGAGDEAGPSGGVIRFTRSGDTASALEVSYAVSGTATPGADFVALPGSVTIPEGSVDVTVPVEVLDDTLYEPLESVVLTVVATPAYAVSSPSTGTVTITSDDQPPDLVVSAFSTPASAVAGTTITVTDTTKNQGLGVAPASETAFYLSSNAAWDVSDLYLGSRPVSELVAGATEAVPTSLDIPPGTAPAQYYIIAKTDAPGVVSESSETNNTRAGASLKVGPDLLVTAFSAPATAAAGGTLQVTDTTKNQGAAGADATVTAFYLSSNATFDAADLPLGSRTVGALAAGVTSVMTTTLTLPANTAVGSYYLLAQADSSGAVTEYLETNNVKASATVRVGANLVVSALSGPAVAGAGTVISINETTKNTGAADVPESITRYYFSVNTTLDAADALLGQRDVPALDAGVSHGVSNVQLIIPAGTATGPYYVFANSDDAHDIAETIETDNSRNFKVNVGPDLTVSDIDGPAAAAPGATLTVTESTGNAGGGPASATVTAFFLSINATLDAADVLLGNRPVPSLTAGQVSTVSVDFTVPAGTANGTYYVIAKADYALALAEVLETNNVRASAVMRVGPDLVVPTLTAPSTVVRGTPFTVSDTTRNDGSPVGATTTSFYLSANSTLDASDLPLGSRAVGALGIAGSEGGQASVAIPVGQATGNYYIIAKADAANAVAEGSEVNNMRARSIRVNP